MKKLQALLMAILLVATMSLSINACRTKETSTEKVTTHVNPISGSESVEKETTTRK